jgi:hypothetical protein
MPQSIATPPAATIAVAHIPLLERPWPRNCLTGLLLAAEAIEAGY